MVNHAKTYHYQTSYERHAMSGHFMDWENQPEVYKGYDNITSIHLPEPGSFSSDNLWDLAKADENGALTAQLDLDRVSRVLGLAYSLTAKVRYPGKDHFYRSVPSAGALYPVEIYLASHSVNGLVQGLYHYGIKDRTLTPLRQQNLGGYIAEAAPLGEGDSIDATVFITGIFFRSAWKYRKRAYRYVLLDAGHVLENLLLALRSEGLNCMFQYDFDDHRIDHLLGVDGRREASIACIHIFGQPDTDRGGDLTIDALSLPFIESSRVAAKETVYEEVQTLHRAGNADRGQHGVAAEMRDPMESRISQWLPVVRGENRVDVPAADLPRFPETVFQRRSRRNFVKKALPHHTLAAMLDLLCAVFQRTPSRNHAFAPSVRAGFLVENIDGVDPGFYLLDPFQRKFGLAAAGAFVEKMAGVCLDQEWLRNASVHFLFMIDLDQTGARGYRHALLTAGRLGHMINLGAQALGLGSCGIGALYDSEARTLLGLTGIELNLVYLVAAGPVKHP